MKINNKGMTLIELILAFIILSIIVLGMLEIVLNVRRKAANEIFARDMLVYRNTMVKRIEDKLIKNEIDTVSCTDLSCSIDFTDSTSTTITLNIDDKYIEFDGIVYDIPKKDYIEMGSSSMGIVPISDDKAMLSIIINYKEKSTSEPNYGFKIMQPINIDGGIEE